MLNSLPETPHQYGQPCCFSRKRSCHSTSESLSWLPKKVAKPLNLTKQQQPVPLNISVWYPREVTRVLLYPVRKPNNHDKDREKPNRFFYSKSQTKPDAKCMESTTVFNNARPILVKKNIEPPPELGSGPGGCLWLYDDVVHPHLAVIPHYAREDLRFHFGLEVSDYTQHPCTTSRGEISPSWGAMVKAFSPYGFCQKPCIMSEVIDASK